MYIKNKTKKENRGTQNTVCALKIDTIVLVIFIYLCSCSAEMCMTIWFEKIYIIKKSTFDPICGSFRNWHTFIRNQEYLIIF